MSQFRAGRGLVTIATVFYFEHRLGGTPSQGDFCAVPRLGREVATRISFDKGFVAALLNSVGIGEGRRWRELG